MKGGSALENKINIKSDMLSGTDSWKSMGSSDFYKAYDGNTSTYFDGVGDGWTMVDLGRNYDISAIGFAPRNGYEYRMADGRFEFSQDGINWQTAYTVNGKPRSGMNYAKKLACGNTARYVRYSVPSGAPKNEYNTDNVYCCNIAEIELYGTPSLAKGDVNSDGSVDTADIVMLQRYLFGKITEINMEAADLCRDDKLNGYDMILLRRLVFAKAV